MITTKQDIYNAMENFAKRERRPEETHLQAYARLLDSNPQMRELYAKAKQAPQADVEREADVAARDTAEAVTKRLAAVRAESPGLTADQAMTKVYRELQAQA